MQSGKRQGQRHTAREPEPVNNVPGDRQGESVRAGGRGKRSAQLTDEKMMSRRRQHEGRAYRGPSQSGFLRVKTGSGLSKEAQRIVQLYKV